MQTIATNSASIPGETNGSFSIPTIVAALLLSALYLYFFAFKAHVEMEIDLLSQGRAWLKIYWADENRGYSESNVKEVLVGGSDKNYSFSISSLGGIERIRIDPVEFATKLRLRKFIVAQPGFDTIEINAANQYAGLEPIQQVSNVAIDSQGLVFETNGKDAQFEYIVDRLNNFQFPYVHVLTVFCILIGTLVAGRVLGGLQKDLLFIPVLLLVAVTLAFIMAVVSKHYWEYPNDGARVFFHPDEEAHATAVEYYRHNWLPPAVDSAAVANSFSVYGYTRLASLELYYPIAGYLSRLLAPLRQPFMADARIIGLLIFALMAVFALRNVEFRPFAAPLLLTPQLWYLYSYANSDGFAVFLATIAAYQAASKQSALNRILSQQRPQKLWLHVAWLGVLAGALILLKLNFYFFVLFLGVYFLWRLGIGDFPDKKLFWTRLALIAVVGLMVYGLRYGLDYAANGPDSKAKVNQMVEQMAEPLYKPSTELHRKHTYLYMKSRGVDLDRILTRESWAGKTFVTAFGAYGYTQFLGSDTYFDLVQKFCFTLFGVMLLSLLLFGPRSSHWLFAITFGCVILLTAASLWQSWTISFQAQGRYLAPILPMLGVLYYHARPWLMNRLFNASLLGLFCLGVYSFILLASV